MMMKRWRQIIAVFLFACMMTGMMPVQTVSAEETEQVEETLQTEAEPQTEEKLQTGAELQTEVELQTETEPQTEVELQTETEPQAETGTQEEVQYAGSNEEITVGEINYVYVESPYLATPDTQRIVFAFDREIENAESVAISVSDTAGNIEEWALSRQSGNLYLFEKSYTGEAYTDTYQVVSLNAKNSVSEKILYMNDLNVDARFGVNEEYEGIEALEPVDGEAAAALSEVEPYVATIDENGAVEVQENIGTALEAAEEDVSGGVSVYSRTAPAPETRANGNIVIVLDPGHDATHSGASANNLKEHELTLKIATYCKEELEKYAGVTIIMTRTTNACAFNTSSSSDCLVQRAQVAADAGADVFVSFHLNSSTSSSADGAEVIVPNYNWKYEVGATGHGLGEKILSELVALGLDERKVYSRDSENGSTYDDGSSSDYYSVIYHNKENGIPGIIIEHAFLTNSSDVNNFLATEAGLKKLGVADAQGIVKYFGLSKGAWETDAAGNKYFYQNGQKVYGEKKIGNGWYYFDPDKNGAMTTGWKNLSGRTLYYDENGAMCFGERAVDGYWYYFNPADGNMWTGWCDLSGKRVYYDSTGKMIFGEKYIDGHWYYLSEKDGAMATGWHDFDDKRVYYNASGAMLFGEQYINGSWYYLSETDGAMVTGWHDFSNKRVYYNANGAMQFGEKYIDGHWYYLSEQDGAMVTGWHDFTDKRVYYNSSGMMLFGEQKISGKWYYLSEADGALKTGLQKINGSYKYYFADGGRASGEYAVGGKWYYFRTSDGAAVTGWYDLPGKRVYYDQNGVMQFGEKNINGYWYYLSESDGSMTTGWHDFENKRVYYNESGKMLFGVQIIGGKQYYLDPQDGKMLTEVVRDGIYYGADGVAVNHEITTYKIEGRSNTDVDQMVSLYNKYSSIEYPGDKLAAGGAESIKDFAEIFCEEAEKEGIRTEVAWAQAMLETGFLKFGGQVKIEQFNFAGLGATDGGEEGADFSSYGTEGVRMGIRAQIQHLKAYASSTADKETLSEECVDARFDLVLPKGCAENVEDLGQKENPDGKGWATSAGYGYYIINLLEKMQDM